MHRAEVRLEAIRTALAALDQRLAEFRTATRDQLESELLTASSLFELQQADAWHGLRRDRELRLRAQRADLETELEAANADIERARSALREAQIGVQTIGRHRAKWDRGRKKMLEKQDEERQDEHALALWRRSSLDER